MKHPNEAFIDLNIRSKLINISELARRLDIPPKTLHGRLHMTGKYKPLSADELIKIETIIKTDLNL